MNRFLFLILISITSTSIAQNLSLQNVDVPPRLENICLENNSEECFIKSITIHINQHLDVDKLIKNKAIGTAYVQFTITKEGKVTNTRARAKSKIMAEVATKAIQNLPIASAAIKDGKPVEIVYTLPVTFNTLSIENNSAVFEGETSLNEFVDLTDASVPPKIKSYKKNFEDITHTLKINFKEQLKQMNFKDKHINDLKITFVITKEAMMRNVLVVSNNSKLRNVVTRMLEGLEILEPALNEKNQPIGVRVIYNFGMN